MPENLQKRFTIIFGRPIATFYACYCCGYFVFVSFSILFSLCFALFCFLFCFYFFSFCIKTYNCSLFVFNVYHQGAASDGRARGTARKKTDRV